MIKRKKTANKSQKSIREEYPKTKLLHVNESVPNTSSKDTPSFKESLKQLQQLQSSILSAIPHAVVGLKDRKIFFANEAVERVFGWKPDEIIGQKTQLLYRNEKDYEEIGRRFYPLLEKQRTHTEDFPCRRKDGQEILCKISASVIGKEMADKGIVVMYEDITKQKNVEKKLQESERKYRELVENANSIILRWNSKGEITFMNEFGQAFFGYSEEEILGRHVVGTIVPEAQSNGLDLRSLMDRISAEPKAFEKNVNENMRRDGSRVWVAWTNKAVFDQQGQLIEVFSIGNDITERKRVGEELNKYREHLEELVKERTAELEQANIRLQELDRLKSMFIASMSHELRTPLNSIIGFTGMTLQGLSGELTDEQKDNLSRVYQSARHLLALITDVIDISKIEAGRIDTFQEVFSLKEIIDEAIDTVKPQLNEKRLTLTVDIPADMMLNTDRKRLLQCLINFLSNGAKFTEKGGITITARERNSDVKISVTDTGIGIAEKDLPKLFEAFERLDTHLRVKTGGTGLGLYLTKKLATDILQGTISVQSMEGQGSTFTLKVPKNLHQTSDSNKGLVIE
jgi:PAS domain S-box-containing protein